MPTLLLEERIVKTAEESSAGAFPLLITKLSEALYGKPNPHLTAELREKFTKALWLSPVLRLIPMLLEFGLLMVKIEVGPGVKSNRSLPPIWTAPFCITKSPALPADSPPANVEVAVVEVAVKYCETVSPTTESLA
ncbi:hypothetical protein HYV30_04230 [Candidatus Kaiserbacteria bacterium]|nr:hypothetical protein [Candidatus Kaiserbacteria bacterium]